MVRFISAVTGHMMIHIRDNILTSGNPSVPEVPDILTFTALVYGRTILK